MDLDEVSHDLRNFGEVLYAFGSDRSQVRAFDREAELDLLQRRLHSPGRKSVILVGPSGSGKSAILHELARRAREWPEPWLFLSTTSNMILAGTRYLGELETRLQEMLNAARQPRRVVLYYRDIVNVPTAGTTAKSNDSVGTFLTPFIESGDLTVFGECTPEQYRLSLEPNHYFSKLFEQVRLTEMTADETRPLLRAVADQLELVSAVEQNLPLQFPAATLESIVELSRDYFPAYVYPGKAARLLEEVVRHEADARLAAGPPAAGEAAPIVVGPQRVIRALERYTGIPRKLLDDTQNLSLEEVRAFFESRVVGQAEATGAIVDLITLIKAGVTDPKKPMGVFLFVGPTGVGKTELAKALAEFIFGSPERMLRYDMSEYKDHQSFEKLIGNPQAQDQSPMRRGSLTTQVRQQPFSVILFDEFEKAHGNIYDLFLQLFDDGRLSDPLGQVTNFTKTIIIMTSNLGSGLARRPSFGFKPEPETDLGDRISDAMREYFRPEFLNRLDRVVNFVPLKKRHMRQIAQRELKRVLERGGIARRNVRVEVQPGVIDVLLEHGFSREYGARPLKRAVENLALLPVARELVRLGAEGGSALLSLQPGGRALQVQVIASGDKQAEAPEPPQVTVADGRRRLKLTPTQLEERAAALDERVGELEQQWQATGLEEVKARLLERSTQGDFWQDNDHARDVLGEIHRIERLAESVERVRRRTDDARHGLAEVARGRDAKKLAELATRLGEIGRQADLVEYGLLCREPRDQADAFVCLTLVDPEPADDDVVGCLADMYTHWSRLRGFDVSLVHEDLCDADHTRELVMLVSGASVYGILRGEEGIHEFLYRKTGRHAKVAKFARVRVLPTIKPTQADVGSAALRKKSQAAKGAGRRIKRYKSLVTLQHKATEMQVQARGDLPAAQLAALCGDWLLAELARREQGPENHGESPRPSVVRRYTLRPTHSAKDLRTGVMTHDLKQLWSGGLDEFLHAYVVQRAEADGHAGVASLAAAR